MNKSRRRKDQPMTPASPTPGPTEASISKWITSACSRCGSPTLTINGAWLRREREMEGLSLRGMARRCGVTPMYLCDIERNRRNCTDTIRGYYEALK